MDDKGKEFLAGACADARKWAMQFPTLAEAWEACERPDWMLWALNMIGFADDKTYRLFACWCVRFTPLGDGRVVWDLLTDERSRNAVEVAERFANGEATREELDAAWAAAGDAAWNAAWAAAWAAAGDAACKAQADQLRKMVSNPFL